MTASPPTDWPQRPWPHTGITVGPCAWRLAMLTGPHHDYVMAHPSLIVVDPSDEDALLEYAAGAVADLPLLLGVAEPAFARQLLGQIEQRLARLGRSRVEALLLHVDDPAEVKSGGMLQTLFDLRDRGVAGSLGLAHRDVRAAEWLAQSSAVRVMGVNYSLASASARYRALEQVQAHGMSAIALDSPGPDEAGLRFALAESGRALAVLDRPIPPGLTPMTAEEVEAAWQAYQQDHSPPAPLPRGKPPLPDG